MKRNRNFIKLTFLFTLSFLFFLNGVCSASNTKQPTKEVVDFLLNTASSEFNSPQSSRAYGFRKVRIGYYTDGSSGRFVLCGSVQLKNESTTEWVQFATVQTSPYEQWLGGVAESICQSKKMTWHLVDQTSELLRRINI